MGDRSYDGVVYPSAIPTPIPTDGLLFKLAVCIGDLYDRLFRGMVPDSDPVEPPDPEYPSDWSCEI